MRALLLTHKQTYSTLVRFIDLFIYYFVVNVLRKQFAYNKFIIIFEYDNRLLPISDDLLFSA